MKKHLLFFLGLFLLLNFQLSAQIPPHYYDHAKGLKGQVLRDTLHAIISRGVTVLDYGDLYTYFRSTDNKGNNVVWDMYSDVPGGTPPYVYHYGVNECGNYSAEGDCFNREHSFPKAWFGGKVYPMYSDLFHIYPTDGYVNNRRSNYPYGETDSPTWTSENGSKLGPSSVPGYSGTVFEPIDAYKGDFARSMFYMLTRYEDKIAQWSANYGSPILDGNDFAQWAKELYLKWSQEDPVSQKEIARNDSVYKFQHNRNPFIDHPEYALYIWGDNTAISTIDQTAESFSVYPNPLRVGQSLYIALTVSRDERVDVTVFDLNGRRFINNQFNVTKGTHLLHISMPQSKGIYLLRITSLGQSFTKRIIEF